MKTKVGLVMAFKGSNYGAQLQAYATQYVIESLGFETSIIDFQRKRFSFSSILFGAGIINYIVFSRIEHIKRRQTRDNITNESFKENKAIRKKQLESFIERKLHNITRYSSYRALKKDSISFEIVLIGSDQKWLPGACYDKINTLNFASSTCKKISYATSLGVSEYPSYCKKMSEKMWKSIDFLSVREITGANIVKSICGDINVTVVVDPTYLISKEEWEELIPFENKEETSYVLCYFLGNDEESKVCARNFCDVMGLKLVSIMSDESFSPIDLSYPDKLITGASPEEFINLIRGSTYIFTDSFHGIAFSIINNKQFFAFYRKRVDAKLSRNSRIDDILSLWKIPNQLILDKKIVWTPELVRENHIDYKKVNKILASERERSLNFLKIALYDENDRSI